ncbi:hypothetical protein ACFV3R_00410 [Streptomyces sp. NPDC059740]|uniref:hypothetical protein n=1 Tax=Streptomyces sp. NPDC059740 TaxID=3346926 RepID=UPI0036652AC2
MNSSSECALSRRSCGRAACGLRNSSRSGSGLYRGSGSGLYRRSGSGLYRGSRADRGLRVSTRTISGSSRLAGCDCRLYRGSDCGVLVSTRTVSGTTRGLGRGSAWGLGCGCGCGCGCDLGFDADELVFFGSGFRAFPEGFAFFRTSTGSDVFTAALFLRSTLRRPPKSDRVLDWDFGCSRSAVDRRSSSFDTRT